MNDAGLTECRYRDSAIRPGGKISSMANVEARARTDRLPIRDAIDILERDIEELDRQRRRLVDAVNLLRDRTGLPPHEMQGTERAVGEALASSTPRESDTLAEESS